VKSTDVTPNLVTGLTYRYVLVATNVFGDSPISEETRVALGSLPVAPNAPVKIEELSSPTSIAVEWNKVVFQDDVPVSGYHLYMDDGYNGDFIKIYDGTSLPFNTSFVSEGLISGLPYRFKV
jgi:hypothetical protein